MTASDSTRERLMARLSAMGADPKRSLGQNFLVSDHVINRILQRARLLPAQAIVEVGPGLGALTDPLRELERPLTLIELDRNFANFWREQGLRIFEADALQLNWQELGLPSGSLLVSNLPYQISSSLVIERCLEPFGIEAMILMFQKEVARRLLAKAATGDYGLLTAMAQSFWEIEFLLEAGPRDFHPPPKIASQVLVFRRKTLPPWLVAKRYLRLLKAGFAHRRKMLAKNLRDGLQPSVTPAAIESAFGTLGLKATVRAEELDPSQFLGLYQHLKGDASS